MEELLETEIFINPGDNLSSSDCETLVLKEGIIALARSKFTQGCISFEDYLDILETCGVNVDEYLRTLENNLHELGIS